MIRICKIKSLIFNDGDYYVFSGWCGENITLVYTGKEPPKILKTVDYKVIGEFENNKKFGRNFVASEFERVGKLKVYKKEKPTYF